MVQAIVEPKVIKKPGRNSKAIIGMPRVTQPVKAIAAIVIQNKVPQIALKYYE